MALQNYRCLREGGSEERQMLEGKEREREKGGERRRKESENFSAKVQHCIVSSYSHPCNATQNACLILYLGTHCRYKELSFMEHSLPYQNIKTITALCNAVHYDIRYSIIVSSPYLFLYSCFQYVRSEEKGWR